MPDALAGAIVTLRGGSGQDLGTVDLVTGWTPAYSLDQAEALQTADFLIYSALTTVARRPNVELVLDRKLALRAGGRQHADHQHLRWTWISFCFTFLRVRPRAVHLRVLAEPPGRRADGSGAGGLSPADAEPAQGGQVFPGGRGGAAGADRCRHDHGARLLRPAQLLRPPCRTSCRSISCATCTSRRRSSGSACRLDRRRPVPRAGDRRRAGGARAGPAGRSAVLGDAAHRRRRADRRLARHHGLYRQAAGSGSAIRACPTSSLGGSGRSASSSAC